MFIGLKVFIKEKDVDLFVGGVKERRRVDGGDTRDNFIVDSYDLTAAASFELLLIDARRDGHCHDRPRRR